MARTAAAACLGAMAPLHAADAPDAAEAPASAAAPAAASAVPAVPAASAVPAEGAASADSQTGTPPDASRLSEADAETAAKALRERHAALSSELAASPFKRPLVLSSTESRGDLKGDVHAVIEQPFERVVQALTQPTAWCDLLILHLNVKHCGVSAGAGPRRVAVTVGKKFDQPLADAYRIDFGYLVAAATRDYLRVQLAAEKGPLGTNNYRIQFEAVPIDAKRSFVHLAYAYGYGLAARIAMQGYLATLGAGKVGFSVVGKASDGEPSYVDGVRGVVERNTMRYYLAIDAYLESLEAPPAGAEEQRLAAWYDATERYPKQLHELERDDYLAMKRREIERQRAGGAEPKR